MEILDQYKELKDQIFTYFGYTGNDREFPISDRREMYWVLEEQTEVLFYHDPMTPEIIKDGTYFEDEVIDDRKIYHGTRYTMITVDTEGHGFLAIFDNEKKQKPEDVFGD